MKKPAIAFALIAALAAPALAADDAVAVRQALMKNSGASAAAAAALMRGDIDYSPVVARSAIFGFNAVGMAYGDFFPEGSAGEGSRAAPQIWEDMDGFRAEIDKFRVAAAAAAEAAGGEGPADLAAFSAAVQPVMASCRSCHEAFRIAD